MLRRCYQTAPEGDELVLLTAPLASTTEVEALFTNGVIDIVRLRPAPPPFPVLTLGSLAASGAPLRDALARLQRR